MLHRALLLSLCILGLLGLATGPAAAAEFRVALVTPGPTNDAGWNASAYAGLRRIEKELGAKISHEQASTPVQFQQAFRAYGRDGYDLVFAHGFEFQDAVMAAGKEFPKTNYVVSSGSVHRANVSSLRFLLEEATYLAGILAAGLSKNHAAGLVGGIELPVIRNTFTAFTRGAQSIRPDFRVATAFTGSFEDVAAARAAAGAQLLRGADILMPNANAANLGAFQAARSRGALAIGTNSDQNDILPDTIAASCVADVPESLVQIARSVKDGSFQGQLLRKGLASGVIRLVINPRFEDRVPAEIKASIADAEKKICDGDLQVLGPTTG
ncbi:MAG: BMP family protein [Deltaproteobacteria bacterium]